MPRDPYPDEHWRFHHPYGAPRLPTRAVTERDGFRHQITGWTDDPRVVIVACGIKVALIGRRHPHPTPCPEE